MERNFDPIYIQQSYTVDNLIKRANQTLYGLTEMKVTHRPKEHDDVLKATREYLTQLKKIQGR